MLKGITLVPTNYDENEYGNEGVILWPRKQRHKIRHHLGVYSNVEEIS